MDKQAFKNKYSQYIEENALFRDYCPLKIGGSVDLLITADSLEIFIEILQAAQSASNFKFYVFGSMSNIIFSDIGFNGAVILNKTRNINYNFDSSQAVVDCGTPVQNLIMQSAGYNLGGLEFLTGTNHSIGGAIYCNYLYQGSRICDYVKRITILTPKGKILTYSGQWLVKNHEKLKKSKEKIVILTALLQMRSIRQDNILEKVADYQVKSNKIYRRFPVSGRLFKTPPSSSIKELILKSRAYKIKHKTVGLNPNDFNRLVNKKNAIAKEARSFIEQVRETVAAKTGVLLEDAIEYFGNW